MEDFYEKIMSMGGVALATLLSMAMTGFISCSSSDDDDDSGNGSVWNETTPSSLLNTTWIFEDNGEDEKDCPNKSNHYDEESSADDGFTYTRTEKGRDSVQVKADTENVSSYYLHIASDKSAYFGKVSFTRTTPAYNYDVITYTYTISRNGTVIDRGTETENNQEDKIPSSKDDNFVYTPRYKGKLLTGNSMLKFSFTSEYDTDKDEWKKDDSYLTVPTAGNAYLYDGSNDAYTLTASISGSTLKLIYAKDTEICREYIDAKETQRCGSLIETIKYGEWSKTSYSKEMSEGKDATYKGYYVASDKSGYVYIKNGSQGYFYTLNDTKTDYTESYSFAYKIALPDLVFVKNSNYSSSSSSGFVAATVSEDATTKVVKLTIDGVEYSKSESAPTSPNEITVEASKAAATIKALRQTTTVIVTGELTSDTLSNIKSAIDYGYNYVALDLSKTSGLDSIPSYAFQNVSNLRSIILPSTVTSIGDYAFAYGRNLKSATIPASVKSIGKYAFASYYNYSGSYYSSSSLKEVVFKNAENWYTSSYETTSGGSLVDSSSLTNPEKAAQLLGSDYSSYYWYTTSAADPSAGEDDSGSSSSGSSGDTGSSSKYTAAQIAGTYKGSAVIWGEVSTETYEFKADGTGTETDEDEIISFTWKFTGDDTMEIVDKDGTDIGKIIDGGKKIELTFYIDKKYTVTLTRQ